MKLLSCIIVVLAHIVSAQAQMANTSPDSIRFGTFDWNLTEQYHFGTDTLKALYAKPLWGVKRLKARLIDAQTSKPITKNISICCAPCDEREAFIEWKTNAPNGVIDQEIACFGTDSFYVKILSDGYYAVELVVNGSHRKGDAVELGTFRMQDYITEAKKMLEEMAAMTHNAETATIVHPSKKTDVWKQGALYGSLRLRLTVEDEAGRPVPQAQVYVESCQKRDTDHIQGKACDKKGRYNETFIRPIADIHLPLDSVYLVVRHPYMQPLRMLLTEKHKKGIFLAPGTLRMKRKPALLPPEKI